LINIACCGDLSLDLLDRCKLHVDANERLSSRNFPKIVQHLNKIRRSEFIKELLASEMDYLRDFLNTESNELHLLAKNLSCWIISKISYAPTLFSVAISLAMALLALYSLIHHLVLSPEQADSTNAAGCPCAPIKMNNQDTPKPKMIPSLKRKSESDISATRIEESKRKRHRIDYYMNYCFSMCSYPNVSA
jgi:hypothetical protein